MKGYRNPELDFVPFVDANDTGLEEKDTDVVTKFQNWILSLLLILRQNRSGKKSLSSLRQCTFFVKMSRKRWVKIKPWGYQEKQEPEKKTEIKSEKVALPIASETADPEIRMDKSIAVDTQKSGIRIGGCCNGTKHCKQRSASSTSRAS